MLSNITVSCAPHISSKFSTRKVMGYVVVGLLPATLMALFYYHFLAVSLLLTCVISCVVTEWACNLIRKKPDPADSLGDLSAIVTGIILAFSVPPRLDLWAAVLGSVVSIAIGKMVFGGLGANIFNPAMVGRAFLTASFGMLMTSWTVPATIDSEMPKISATNVVEFRTQATPLAKSKEAIKSGEGARQVNKQIKYTLTGEIGGCLGETSAIAIIVGGVFLIAFGVVSIHIPLAVLLSAFLFSSIFYLIDPAKYISPVMHLTSGGILLGAFFIATDPVTAPLTRRGMWLFGAGVGILTMLVRIVGEYPGGVMYSVLLMNAATPLIDRLFKRVPSGGKPNG